MNEIFFRDLTIRKPDYFLGVKSDTLGGQVSNIILKSEEVLLKEKPDAVLILGDTNSALAAIVAKRMKIPIFHMEAGNRCFDENVPEEINRQIVDHISDINMPYSENARLYLMREGIHPGTIFVTGSPVAEVLEFNKKGINSSKILTELKLKKDKYFVASIHREENIEKPESFKKLLDALNAIAGTYKMPVLVSTHPRTAKKLIGNKVKINSLVNFHKPLGYHDYVNLQMNSFCVVSDSGTIQEEASLLGFPAIQARVSSERPEAFDKGTVILSGLDSDTILNSIDIVTKTPITAKSIWTPKDYMDTNVSDKVLRLIVGLTKIVKAKYR
jgi:UDP-N-acetylglucosamine 2-epimerase (non-hydrolysing)